MCKQSINLFSVVCGIVNRLSYIKQVPNYHLTISNSYMIFFLFLSRLTSGKKIILTTKPYQQLMNKHLLPKKYIVISERVSSMEYVTIFFPLLNTKPASDDRSRT